MLNRYLDVISFHISDNNGKDELITGLNSSLGPALYKCDATTIGYAKNYQGATSIGNLKALTSGKYGTACKMYVGFYHATTGTIVKYHDGNNFISQVYTFAGNYV